MSRALIKSPIDAGAVCHLRNVQLNVRGRRSPIVGPVKKLRVGERRFGVEDQLSFGSLSGDMNPMHVDPVAARRTQAGALVVHGVHTFLWALDRLLAGGFAIRPIAAISVDFRKFVYVGETVCLTLVSDNEEALHAELSVDGLRAAVLDLTFGPQDADCPLQLSREPVPEASRPTVLRVSELEGKSGFMREIELRQIASLFPFASEKLDAHRITAIVQLSTLVGMICPGLHSTFAQFKVRIKADSLETRGISYRVRAVDERFRMVEMDVSGGGISGSVTAFVRQPSVTQPTVRELRSVIRGSEFSGTTALIVGGSRGLGALCASIIAAGGGRVIVTYAIGEADAQELAAEIGVTSCRVLKYDAMQDAGSQLAQMDWSPNQVYYFATAQIYRQRAGWYDADRFDSFCRMYVNGFEALCSSLRSRDAAPLIAFYPSTVYVEERPRNLAEYSMAKAAGEILCAEMNRSIPGIQVLVRRLPRLLTDQTATLIPDRLADPVKILLPIIREMHGR